MDHRELEKLTIGGKTDNASDSEITPVLPAVYVPGPFHASRNRANPSSMETRTR